MKREKEIKKSGIRMQWKLLIFLLLFCVFMLLVIWLFQIRFLGSFYRNAKYKELETISGIMQSYLDTESLDDAVASCSMEYDACIRVFKRTEERVFAEVASADVSSVCAIHHLTEERLQYFYKQASNSGGSYMENQEFDSNAGNFWSSGNENEIRLPLAENRDEKTYGIVYNRLMTSKNGAEYMVMLNSVLTPVSATVQTLKTQFFWICVVLLIGAFLLAFFISRNISRPLSDMNRAAKQLALGRYDADFKGYGCREIRELGDSLNEASSELSKLDKLQRELIANVSHDLRTPLTMLKGYSEMMRDIPEENTPENMQVLIDETTRLGELVTDLLDLSKLRAEARELTFESFDLTEVVQTAMARYDRLVASEGYEIVFESEGHALVCADRGMILQVIYNLINNAVNYAGDDKRVRVVQTLRENVVKISVIDNGQGIAPEDIRLIWDRYYRVDAIHKRAVVGSGLGLSIVKGILELHQARYGVESALGHGSTFWFEMDVEEKEDEHGE